MREDMLNVLFVIIMSFILSCKNDKNKGDKNNNGQSSQFLKEKTEESSTQPSTTTTSGTITTSKNTQTSANASKYLILQYKNGAKALIKKSRINNLKKEFKEYFKILEDITKKDISRINKIFEDKKITPLSFRLVVKAYYPDSFDKNKGLNYILSSSKITQSQSINDSDSVSGGSFDIQYLLENKADPNFNPNKCELPLINALKGIQKNGLQIGAEGIRFYVNYINIIALLLINGAKLKLKDIRGINAFSEWQETESIYNYIVEGVCEILVKQKSLKKLDPNFLVLIEELNKIDETKFKGININLEDIKISNSIIDIIKSKMA